MESVKEGSSSVDYSHYTDQALDRLEGQLERRKNCIESPLSSWTVVHETDSWGETLTKIALAVFTLGASMGIPTFLEFLFHKPDQNALAEINAKIEAISTARTQKAIDRAEENNAKAGEGRKVERPAPFDMGAARAKRIKQQVEKDALKGIDSREFKKQIMALGQDDLSASMITAYIQSASSLGNAIELVEASGSLTGAQLKELERILGEATSPKIFNELCLHYGPDEAQIIFARDYQAA
ncbi:MAG: hypothetical protein H7A41_05145 [Chlamydiales bacterium]|nr:hypothetical protein [Chlamydiales bacterium]